MRRKHKRKSNAKSTPKALERARKAALAKIRARSSGTPAKGIKSIRGKIPVSDEKAIGKSTASPAGATVKPKRLSALGAAAQVLAAQDKPMRVKELVAEMEKQGLWSTAKGKTPHATLAAAIMREIVNKGKDARFRKVERGLFAASSVAKGT